MHVPKASSELGKRANAAAEHELLDVVVELTPPASAQETGHLSRAEKIAAKKSAFRETAKPLADLIASRGGQVTDEAWLNNTLRAKVPVRCLTALGAADEVSALDVAAKIERE